MRSAMSSRHGAVMICTPMACRTKWARHRDDRQANEGYRLGIDADIRPQRHLLPVQHERLLPDQWRDAWCCRRQDRIDVVEQPQHLRTEPAAKFLRLSHGGGGHQCAGNQPVTHIGVEVVRPGAQPPQVQCRALASW